MNKNIGWIVPFPNIEGSGGIKTIFDHIKCLQGIVSQDIYVNKCPDIKNTEQVRYIIEKQFGKMPDVNIIYGHDKIKNGHDLLIATFSLHAFRARKVQAKKKLYFIQDLEHLFFEMGDNYIYAKESYTYGFEPIVIGKYLKRVFEKDFKMDNVKHFDFCADLDIYKPIKIEKENAVCFLYQPEKPRRCANIGLKALKILKTLLPDLTVYLYGSNKESDTEFINLGLLTTKELNELYNKCKLGICANTTNPSRTPFEMMASGLPCLTFGGEDNLDDFMKSANDCTIIESKSNYEAIALESYYYLNSPYGLETYRYNGLDFMKGKDLSVAFKQFQEIIQEKLND